MKKGANKFYKIFVQNIKFPEKYKEKWIADLNITDFDWKFIHKCSHNITNDTKLRWFQLRIIHRILATNRYLTIIKIQNDSNCSFCKVEEETIIHLFSECDVVNNFLISFENWIYDKTSVLLKFF